MLLLGFEGPGQYCLGNCFLYRRLFGQCDTRFEFHELYAFRNAGLGDEDFARRFYVSRFRPLWLRVRVCRLCAMHIGGHGDEHGAHKRELDAAIRHQRYLTLELSGRCRRGF